MGKAKHEPSGKIYNVILFGFQAKNTSMWPADAFLGSNAQHAAFLPLRFLIYCPCGRQAARQKAAAPRDCIVHWGRGEASAQVAPRPFCVS